MIVSHSFNMTVCNDVCVREGSPQSPVSYYPQTFMRSCLSHTVDTIVTDRSCCAKRKTPFKIHVFKSNCYSTIRAIARLNSRWHSITLPLMEENLSAKLTRPPSRPDERTPQQLVLDAICFELWTVETGPWSGEAWVSSGSNRWWEETEPSWKAP